MDRLQSSAQRLLAATGLDAKLAAATDLLAAAMAHWDSRFALAWTGGKDSTLLVWLARSAARQTGRPMPRIVTIAEGDDFPEIVAFRQRLARQWDLPLTELGNSAILSRQPAVGDFLAVDGLDPANQALLAQMGFTGPGFPFDPDSPLGCRLMKIAPLNAFLRDQAIAALGVAIRRDEHPARADETALSPRTEPPHLRLHPLLPLRERDIWDATFRHDIPFCDLYRHGYRSLGTRSGSQPAAACPAWEQDLEHTPERAGRAPDKERAMANLRSLGYM